MGRGRRMLKYDDGNISFDLVLTEEKLRIIIRQEIEKYFENFFNKFLLIKKSKNDTAIEPW